jgi:hypothetical protein
MEYKVELLANNQLLVDDVFKKMSHPNQAIRKAVGMAPKDKYDFMIVYILNNNGEVWAYGVEKKKSGYRAYPVDHDMLHHGEVLKVFSGMKTIRGLVA